MNRRPANVLQITEAKTDRIAVREIADRVVGGGRIEKVHDGNLIARREQGGHRIDRNDLSAGTAVTAGPLSGVVATNGVINTVGMIIVARSTNHCPRLR